VPFTTISSAGPDIADGVYPVILSDIKGDPNDPTLPKTVTAQRGPKAGQDIELWDWVFAVDDGQHDGVVLEVSTSTASGPRSKMYGFLTALFGGIAPPIGTSLEKTDLVGRRALATVRKDESGWPRIENLGAMPAQMLQQRFAAATGAPTTQAQPAAQPLRETVAAGTAVPNDLPF
jgi:hypothetical protein